VADCRNLAFRYRQELDKLTANAEDAARLRHLRLHMIEDAGIPLLGPRRKESLADRNILTAADINAHALEGIYGIGDAITSHLLNWKAEVLRAFRFDPSAHIPPGVLRPVAAKYRSQQQHLLGLLQQDAQRLESLVPTCRTRVNQLLPAYQRALATWEQARL